MKNLIILLVIVTVFTSCITSTIEIHNNTNSKISFRSKFSQDIKDSTIIISPNKSIFVWQMGSFSDANLVSHVERMDFFELKGLKSSLLIKNKPDILQFLKKHKKGLFNNRIKIIINEPLGDSLYKTH